MFLKITINLESELLIAQHRGAGNLIEGVDFIPGTVIRGLVATTMLESYYSKEEKKWRNGDEDKKRFSRLFFTSQTRFGNLYIGSLKTRVLPKTARSCKYYSGFNSVEFHGLWDLLIPSLRYNRTKQWDEKYERCNAPIPLPFKRARAICGSLIDHISGYYEENRMVAVQKRIITHTRVSDSRGSAIPGALFSQEVVNEGQMFSGLIAGESKEDLAFIKTLLETEKGNLRIGSGRTRGMGCIEIVGLELIENPGTREELRGRFGIELKRKLDGLNSTINQEIVLSQESSSCFFSITLDTDMIILDEFMRYKGYLDIPDLIREFCYSKRPDNYSEIQSILTRFQLKTDFHSSRLISGWDMAIGYPKEDRLTIAKGSVFLFGLKDGEKIEGEDRNTLINILSSLEEKGIGEDKNEGFGQVSVCDTFHWGGGWPK